MHRWRALPREGLHDTGGRCTAWPGRRSESSRHLREGRRSPSVPRPASRGLTTFRGPRKPTAAAIRSQELAHRIATEPADSMPFDIELGLLSARGDPPNHQARAREDAIRQRSGYTEADMA